MKTTHPTKNRHGETHPKNHGNGAKEVKGNIFKVGETVNVVEAVPSDNWRGRIVAFKSSGHIILKDVTHSSERNGCSLWRHQDRVEKINN